MVSIFGSDSNPALELAIVHMHDLTVLLHVQGTYYNPRHMHKGYSSLCVCVCVCVLPH